MEVETESGNAGQEATKKEEAFTHLAQGKRHLLVKDYSEAVASFASACQLLSELYGELANECGEAYFNYGIALLELARTESDVLGIEGEGEESQDSDGDDEGEDEKEEENTADSEINHVENGKGNEHGLNEKEKSTTEAEPKNINERNGTKDSKCEGKDNSTENGEDEDDISNLRLAWEMLELAKVIFRRQAERNKKINLKLAEVHLKLGEVGLESETYVQAIEDMKICLEIRIQNLDKHDRSIAETHYQLGMAYSLVSDFDEAIGQLTLAHKLLEERIEYLQERGKQSSANSEENENPFYTIEGEITEITALLPEVKEKINDTKDLKEKTKTALMAGLDAKKEIPGSSESEQGASSGSSGAFIVSLQPESGSKPVSDISHLVRKKRKLEPNSSEEKCSKQPCPEGSKLE